MKRNTFYARTSKDEIEELRRNTMAKDPAVGPVTLYDAHGNPLPVINPDAELGVPEEAAPIDLPVMRTTLEGMKMPALRAFAKDIGAKPARSKAETVERIMAALSAGVTSVDLPDDWQAPPLTVPSSDSPFGPASTPQPTQKSVRVRRIEEASGKKEG